MPPSVVGGASQPQNHSFESLKRTLSSKSERESLYILPSEWAIGVINHLEQVSVKQISPTITSQRGQGSREDSGLCAYHRERFSMVLWKMCRTHNLLPSSYTTTNEPKKIEELPSGNGGNADVWCGMYLGSKVAIKVLRVQSRADIASIERVRPSPFIAEICRLLTRVEQSFCREVVLWKQFRHPNLLPLVGATKSSHALMMVSEWMEYGTIVDFVTARPETNRLKLVSITPKGLK